MKSSGTILMKLVSIREAKLQKSTKYFPTTSNHEIN